MIPDKCLVYLSKFTFCTCSYNNISIAISVAQRLESFHKEGNGFILNPVVGVSRYTSLLFCISDY